MADLGMTFRPDEVPERENNFDPIPAGEYLLQVTDSDVVATKSGEGQILKLTFEVVDGPYENRKVFENLNISNPNAQAQSIAQRNLADLCLATGLTAARDSEDLHFRPFLGRVAIEKDKTGNYPDKNRIRAYRPAQSMSPAGKAAPVRPTPAPSAAPSARPAGAAPSATSAATNGSRPWNRPAAS